MKTYNVSISFEVCGIEADSIDEAKSELLRLIEEDRNIKETAWEHIEAEEDK